MIGGSKLECHLKRIDRMPLLQRRKWAIAIKSLRATTHKWGSNRQRLIQLLPAAHEEHSAAQGHQNCARRLGNDIGSARNSADTQPSVASSSIIQPKTQRVDARDKTTVDHEI